MPARVVVTGIILVVLTAFLVVALEFFLPLSAKSDMNIWCRSTMLRMEMEGELSDQAKLDLHTKLAQRGFVNIDIEGVGGGKQGEEINLRVEADYIYSRLTGLFIRSTAVQRMVYDKTSVSRRVVN